MAELSGFAPQAQNEDPEVAALQKNYQRNAEWAKPGDYTTKLAPAQELQFRQWLGQTKAPYDLSWPPDQRMQDYDMRGFWQAQQQGDPQARQAAANGHFPDTWKTPYHESFSNQSQYALPSAPAWKGKQLVGQGGKVLYEDKN
jgi:hypothetical protein